MIIKNIAPVGSITTFSVMGNAFNLAAGEEIDFNDEYAPMVRDSIRIFPHLQEQRPPVSVFKVGPAMESPSLEGKEVAVWPEPETSLPITAASAPIIATPKEEASVSLPKTEAMASAEPKTGNMPKVDLKNPEGEIPKGFKRGKFGKLVPTENS